LSLVVELDDDASSVDMLLTEDVDWPPADWLLLDASG